MSERVGKGRTGRDARLIPGDVGGDEGGLWGIGDRGMRASLAEGKRGR